MGGFETLSACVVAGEGRGWSPATRKAGAGGTITAVLRIRRYRPADRQAVWALHNLALNAVGAHAGNGPWDDDMHHIPEVYLADRGEFLVGVEDGRLVAMAALRRRDDATAEVKRMRVHPNAQRGGHGRRLLRRIEARAVELGYARLVLDTTERQVAAIGLYTSEGYQETGRATVYGFPCIFYAKTLGEARSARGAAPRRLGSAAARGRIEGDVVASLSNGVDWETSATQGAGSLGGVRTLNSTVTC